MMKVFIPFAGIIIILVSIFDFVSDSTNFGLAIVLASCTCLLSLLNIITNYGGRFTLSSSLVSYTIATQFGLVIPYFIFGNIATADYPDWTLYFLDSKLLTSAVLLGCIGISSFEIGRYFACKIPSVHYSNIVSEDKLNTRLPLLMLLAVFLYFAVNILTGGMALFGTYEMYCNSAAYNSSLYPYILILFYIATIYLTVAGSIKENKLPWIIWSIIVVIFAVNGNKGEFLYALLSALGVKGIQGLRISKKMIVGVLLLIFVVIPSITSLRDVGIAGNLNSVSFNPFGAFAEMGMQIRTTVYSLESLQTGEISYLNGASYWQPIINILTPSMEHNVATGAIRKLFPGYGFNQVIESYLNFGVLGPILFFGLLGFYLSKNENSVSSQYKLAFLGSMTTVLINASRNYFVFVPGQVLICYFVYLIAKRTSKTL